MLFKNFTRQFMTAHAAAHNKPQELVNKNSVLTNHLLPFFGDMNMMKITSQTVGEFIGVMKDKPGNGGRTLSFTTINQSLKLLGSILNKAVEWGKIKSAPKIQKLRCPVRNDLNGNWLTEDEAKLLLDKCRPTFPVLRGDQEKPVPIIDAIFPNNTGKYDCLYKIAFYITLKTGLRFGELKNLKRNEINDNNQFEQFITVNDTKSGISRTIPISHDVYEMLDSYLSNLHYIVNPTANRHLKELLTSIGVTRNVTFHGLRHTYATLLLQKGLDVRTVQDLLGHSNLTMTMKYLHAMPAQKKKAALLLEDL